MSNEEIIWKFLSSKLNNQYGAAALMGNLFAESSLNPILANNIKKKGMTSEQYTTKTDNGTYTDFAQDGVAYGLAQWCYKTRKQGLLDKAKAYGKSVGNIYLQLDYLWEELQKYTTVIKALYDAKDIREASDVVLLRYEKPANTSEAVRIKRANFGKGYYNKYATKPLTVNFALSRKAAKELERKL